MKAAAKFDSIRKYLNTSKEKSKNTIFWNKQIYTRKHQSNTNEYMSRD